MRLCEHAHDRVLTIIRWDDRNAYINVAETFNFHFEPAILWEQVFIGVQTGQHFDTAHDLRVQITAHFFVAEAVIEQTIDAIADAKLITGRLNVNIRRACAVSILNKQINQLDDGNTFKRLPDLLFYERF